jgi:hypothetical protein
MVDVHVFDKSSFIVETLGKEAGQECPTPTLALPECLRQVLGVQVPSRERSVNDLATLRHVDHNERQASRGDERF